VEESPDAADTTAREQEILARMLADAERLCETKDPLLVGQYRYLYARVAALIELCPQVGA